MAIRRTDVKWITLSVYERVSVVACALTVDVGLVRRTDRVTESSFFDKSWFAKTFS
jgi:hypothetical protein